MIPLRIIWRAIPKALKWAAVGLLALLMAFYVGRAWERNNAALKAAKSALETHERIDNADVSSGDADADREWLRDRGN